MVMERNWAGNYVYRASRYHSPESVEEIQDWVARSERIKGLGTRHSFNGIADTSGCLLSLQKLNRVISLDKAQSRVTVEAGIRYGELSQYLHSQGYALPNLASLPHISVAGACTTATHGSGDRNGCLATTVHAIELVKADGQLIAFSRDDQDGRLDGAVVGLGGLGIVTKLTLDVVPTFEISQRVYEQLPLEQATEHMDAIFSSAYSVSLFTNWQQPRFTQAWVKSKVAGPDALHDQEKFYGAVAATDHRHPLQTPSAEHCTPQMGLAGPWHERLPHFRMDFTPSFGEELQSEYFVPRHRACEALLSLSEIGDQISPVLYVSEVRTVARDQLWMSPCYEQDSVAIHFTWRQDLPRVQQVLSLIEERLEPFQARPHWGKLFTVPPEGMRALYGKLPEFQELLRACDPQGKFSNEFLQPYRT